SGDGDRAVESPGGDPPRPRGTMLNIGPLELMVILLVALLVVGPQRLPEVGRSVAKVLRELRRQTDEVRSSFEATINPDFDDPDEPEEPGGPSDEAGPAPAGPDP